MYVHKSTHENLKLEISTQVNPIVPTICVHVHLYMCGVRVFMNNSTFLCILIDGKQLKMLD